MADKTPKLPEIAKRIGDHLRRIEADPKLNPKLRERMDTRRFFHASAFATGRHVQVSYISYQGWSALSKADALRYLAWLDAGNVGRHYEALR